MKHLNLALLAGLLLPVLFAFTKNNPCGRDLPLDTPSNMGGLYWTYGLFANGLLRGQSGASLSKKTD